MRKRLLILVAVVALLTATFAGPASATGQTRHGDFDITLYVTPCSEEDPESPLLTWAGTVDFGWRTLGIAWFDAELTEIGDTGWLFFEDDITLFWLPRGELSEEKLIDAACNPHRRFLHGDEAGVSTPTGTGFGTSEVIWARGWWHKYVGGQTFWYGAYTSETGDTFAGTLWLVPGNTR